MVTREDVTSPHAWPAGFWVRANLVANNSGATAGPSGTSTDLTNREDRELLRLIRRDCDALIVGFHRTATPTLCRVVQFFRGIPVPIPPG